MKSRKCDLCGIIIDKGFGVSFGVYDLCSECVEAVRRAVCLKCKGTGKMRVRDDDATFAQATCGENRTEYKTVNCDRC